MNENKLKILLDGIVNIVKAIKCKITCCKSSCNTIDDTENKTDTNNKCMTL